MAICALFCIDHVLTMFDISVPVLAWIPHGNGLEFSYVIGDLFLFPTDPVLTSHAVAYRNRSFIADLILPRKPVGKREFKYNSIAKGTYLTIPDTKVGKKSEPNQVEMGFTQVDSSCEDYGLDDLVPQDDIDNAPPGYDPKAHAAEYIMDCVELDREKRVADTVFNADNFASGNKATLSGTSQFSSSSSTPIATIQDAIDACFYRPNYAVMGRAVMTALSRHASIVSAVNASGSQSGIARRRQIAELFELEDIFVGESFYNTAKPGQTAVVTRLWGKSLLLFYQNPMADNMRGATFGFTAQFGSRIAGTIPEPKKGLRGSHLVRAGESVKEIIMATDLGYLFSDAVA